MGSHGNSMRKMVGTQLGVSILNKKGILGGNLAAQYIENSEHKYLTLQPGIAISSPYWSRHEKKVFPSGNINLAAGIRWKGAEDASPTLGVSANLKLALCVDGTPSWYARQTRSAITVLGIGASFFASRGAT
ncbi:MAG TPA: hypothetical protein DF383_03575, partial [Deltaproteobacteria bacterium]|nr:hypothetical protein [Deltaproteobacteria bacterium]